MNTLLRRIVFIAIPIILSACTSRTPAGLGLADPDGLPTPIPTEHLPTAIALTVAAGRPASTPAPTFPASTAAPTASVTPTKSATPTVSPTPTITPAPTNTPVPLIPLADIEIRTPGSLSKVISPIPLRAALIPGAGGRVTVELLGEDSRLLARQLVTLNENLGRKAGLALDLPFEIPGVSELGRLKVSINDEFGRPQAVESVDLILLSSGSDDLNAVVDLHTRLVIQDPLPGDLIQGGKIIVSGYGRPVSDQPLLAELVTQEGKVVGMRVFSVEDSPDTPVSGTGNSIPGNEYRPFLVEVPYTVTEPTWVRLIIQERGDRIPGTTFLTSVEILISP